jgi:hypothetical protein
MSRPAKKKIRYIERGASDRIVPKGFGEIIARRFLPVLSLTYISAVIGIAAQRGDLEYFLFRHEQAYIMGLVVAAWVSVPAVIWIILHESPLYTHIADIWYRLIAGLMTLVLMASFILFPEANVYGLRIYFAAAIPVFVIMYLFFVRGGLPSFAAYPLSALGLAALMHGAFLAIF